MEAEINQKQADNRCTHLRQSAVFRYLICVSVIAGVISLGYSFLKSTGETGIAHLIVNDVCFQQLNLQRNVLIGSVLYVFTQRLKKIAC